MIDFSDAKKILNRYGQGHILEYWNELEESERTELLSQIELVDFSVIEKLDEEKESISKRGKFQPLGAVTVKDIGQNYEKYFKTGVDTLKKGKICAVLLAGGQGTRLGYDKPKGMFNIGVERELYIFECLINNLMRVVNTVGKWVHLYIMTSEKNNEETVKFFEEKNFFGYNPEYIDFFIQDMAPSVDFDGKIYMESKSRISMSPNGNGGWFTSMVRAGLLDKIKSKGIEWINVFAVDNVLQQIADPLFAGAVIDSGMTSGGKVVRKADPDEKVGVLCLEDGMPSIVEYYEMTEEMRTQLDEDGNLAYKFGVILNYLFRTDELEEMMHKVLPVHVVKKKIPYMDGEGKLVNPDQPNGYKFETLVLDMVHLQKSCLPYEVIRSREFAPVKNLTGVDSVESARKLLSENGIKL